MATRHYCSDGSRVTENTIKSKYGASLKKKHEGQTVFICGCGCGGRADHNDHTIAKARCKVIHKTELIWHPDNYESSCAKSHAEWENFKSGLWIEHANVQKRLAFLKKHDPEGYAVRIELTQLALIQHDNEHNNNRQKTWTNP
jgi:hypothetical protein